MKKLKVSIILIAMLVLSTITLCYAETKSDIKVIYNAKALDFGDKSVVNKDGSMYIPIRALSQQLYYTVDWDGTTSTARIHDNLNDVYLSMNGDVKINGTSSKSEKVPIMVNGSVYVPLRLVSESLGVSVNYDSKTRKVYMFGRDIYEVSQKDLTMPYLIAYTPEGRKQVGLIGKKVNEAWFYEDEWRQTSIFSVVRTKYSDVVTTTYMASAAFSTSENNTIYVHDGKIAANTIIETHNYDMYSQKYVSTEYLDDRVAFITTDDTRQNTYVSIFDDVTGELIKKIDTVATYGEELGKKTEYDNIGETYNIQAVGKDFVVVNMYQHYTGEIGENIIENLNTNPDYVLMTDSYYTTVINLDTMEITPVYKYFENYKVYSDLEFEVSYTETFGMTPGDGIYFEKVNDDGTLGFARTFESKDGVNWNGERASVPYK